MNQDADIHAGFFDGAEQADFDVRPGRDVWIQVARGELTVNGELLVAGDGASLAEPGSLQFSNGQNAEVLVFDMARGH